ncbi:uncharacterized protein H6S33_009007 [Morchella sextelata]|uniref:uncharacterized protein n=1 Tax=Morchella sextelata TaxID=1174677 RepID=UPI001D0522ED|nr:uncharacterized protein H6S33_009007 [Morchella sextelata]KAH0612627.1 hypothetical protein H6S33_009007 [Morchella sextelata]
MHPRSPYAEYTDFAQLAEGYPSLAKHLVNNSINFKDPDAVRELTKCLLKRDFGLTVDLPEDRLCPTVPNRLNYVLWMQDLIDSTSGGPTDDYDPGRKVVGLDIGTGASCIYPLLACASRPGWHMYGSDIDAASLRAARSNTALNADLIGGRITVLESTPDGPLFPPDIETLDFTMCNPPFYGSAADHAASAAAKALPPSSACTGSAAEMVYAGGGEVGFVARIIEESWNRGGDTTWYSSMVGKLASLAPLVESVRARTGNYAVTEFRQGATRRWGLAWCWGGLRPRGVGGVRGVGAPFPTVVAVGGRGSVGRVVGVVEGLGVGWVGDGGKEGGPVEGEGDRVVGRGEARGDVWSRKARRRKGRGEMEVEGGEVKMGFRVEVVGGEVVVRWTRGTDQVLFESFCGMLRRCVKEAPQAA